MASHHATAGVEMLKRWIIERQFGRRNLTPFQRAELALLLKPMLATEAKKRQGTRTDLPPNIVPTLAQCPISRKTRDSIAEKAGISHGSLDKADFISQHADQQTKQKLRSGDSSINAEYRRLKKEIGQAGTHRKPPLTHDDAERVTVLRFAL